MSKSRDIADSAATINYIDGLTSDAQSQINTAQSQIDNFDPLPSQTGNTGKFLKTDGSTASWADAGGVSLDGPTDIYKTLPSDFTITNYDIATTYLLSTTDGTISRTDEVITFTPTSTGTASFSVNGKIFDFTVLEVAAGQQAFTTVGTYTWVAPLGVSSVSIVTVGGGALSGGYNDKAGGGAALGYKNNVPVTPGQSYTVVVGGDRSISRFETTVGAEGGIRNPTGTPQYSNPLYGSSGGRGVGYANSWSSGGGGAGGYSGDGGCVMITPSGGSAGDGAGGGGGAGGGYQITSGAAGGGGGVGILGEGASGLAGNNSTRTGGGGGSGGANGANGTTANSNFLVFNGGRSLRRFCRRLLARHERF